jgi:hypothetical protein
VQLAAAPIIAALLSPAVLCRCGTDSERCCGALTHNRTNKPASGMLLQLCTKQNLQPNQSASHEYKHTVTLIQTQGVVRPSPAQSTQCAVTASTRLSDIHTARARHDTHTHTQHRPGRTARHTLATTDQQLRRQKRRLSATMVTARHPHATAPTLARSLRTAAWRASACPFPLPACPASPCLQGGS